MKRIIDVDENLICEGFVRNFTEEEKDVLINAIRNSTPIDNVANAEETEDYIINQEENCNIVCDFLRDITGVDIRKGKKSKWIPVSERLPEEHGYYLVTTDGSHNAVIDIAEYGKFYRKPENEYVLEWNKASRVIAWQPLPEPYKKSGTE